MTEQRSDLPRIGAPATRALTAAGISRISQLEEVSEAQLAEMHGMGPKAIGLLRDALAAQGRSFATE